MQLIFKELEAAIKQTMEEQQSIGTIDKVRERQLKERRVLLDEIVDYINTYEWLKQERTIVITATRMYH